MGTGHAVKMALPHLPSEGRTLVLVLAGRRRRPEDLVEAGRKQHDLAGRPAVPGLARHPWSGQVVAHPVQQVGRDDATSDVCDDR